MITNSETKSHKNSNKVFFYAVISFCVASILIIFLPIAITKLSLIGLEYEPNEIGDTLGGIMGPAVALLAAALTFLAFWVQYEANIEQKKQFKIQIEGQEKQHMLEQVESRVFKLVDVYNSNVSQMSFKSRFSNTLYEGKSYFYTLYIHFAELLKEIESYDNSKNVVINDRVSPDYIKNLGSKNSLVEINKWISYELAYVILYFGVGKMGRENIKEVLSLKYKDDYFVPLINYFSNKPADINTNPKSSSEWNLIFTNFEDFENPNTDKFNRFYNGQQSRLGHYFRQLFMSINYINDRSKLTYQDKWDYAKNFRSLFSNHEQLIILLNSISILGRDWELNHISDKNKGLITKYDLIKNIPKAYRIKYQIDEFYPNVEFEEENQQTNQFRINLDNNVYS